MKIRSLFFIFLVLLLQSCKKKELSCEERPRKNVPFTKYQIDFLTIDSAKSYLLKSTSIDEFGFLIPNPNLKVNYKCYTFVATIRDINSCIQDTSKKKELHILYKNRDSVLTPLGISLKIGNENTSIGKDFIPSGYKLVDSARVNGKTYYNVYQYNGEDTRWFVKHIGFIYYKNRYHIYELIS